MSFQIQHYIIEQIIANGRYGKIVLGKHTLVNERVVIKIIEKKQIKSNKDLQELENEITILRQIKHSNIIQLFEILESNQNIYLIFEYGEGEDLQKKLNQQQQGTFVLNRFSEAQSLVYLQQIVNAIHYLHDKQITHSKIRLDNIVLQNGKPKLIGFSECNQINQEKDITRIKLQYQSPEMLNSLYYDFEGQSYDMWCLGLILYHMLQGQLPFDNIINNTDLKGKLKKSQYQIIYPISQNISYLLEQLLNPDPQKRMKLQDLENFLESQNFLYEDDILKIPNDIPLHLILKDMELQQIETTNLFQLLEQNKHCTITTCYYLIKNKMLRRAKINKIRNNFMEIDQKGCIVKKLRNSLHFTTTKSRVYQNGMRLSTESSGKNDYSSLLSQSNTKQRSISRGQNIETKKIQIQQQYKQYHNTQTGFHKNKFQQLGIICDNYQKQQDNLQNKLRQVLQSYNNNYIVQVTKSKKRSVTLKN